MIISLIIDAQNFRYVDLVGQIKSLPISLVQYTVLSECQYVATSSFGRFQTGKYSQSTNVSRKCALGRRHCREKLDRFLWIASDVGKGEKPGSSDPWLQVYSWRQIPLVCSRLPCWLALSRGTQDRTIVRN
jgi:hypothetical protein